MTQMKLGASHIGGSLFKSVATSVLALTALTGGVMLSVGEVKAGNVVNYTDLGIDFTDTLTVIQAPTYTGGGPVLNTEIDLELTGALYPSPQKQIDTDFNGPLDAPATSIYKLTKTGFESGTTNSPDVWFSGIGLSVLPVPGDNPTARKQVYSDAALTNLIADITTGSSSPIVMLPNKYNMIWIVDTYNAGPNAKIDAVVNAAVDYVPGPLPILGAGAAFGFSRKLRGRIKASRTA